MAKIVSTMKQALMEKFGVEKPEGWEIEYVDFPCSDDVIAEACKDADYFLCGPVDVISRELIEKISHIKLIHSLGVGFDKIDLQAAKENNIYVCNNHAVNAAPVAELAVTLMINSARRIAQADSAIKNGGFHQQFQEYRVKGQRELGGQTVGLVGMGAIGKVAAKILNAYGSKLYYSDVIKLDDEFEKQYNIERVSFDEICEKCDIISFHVPVLDSTRGMVNKEAIAKMKQDVIIINVSRGEIVNNEDLKEALENERVYAGLDVIAPEPPSDDHPLLNLNEVGNSRLTITPHIAGTTDDAFIRMQTWVYENMIRVEKGEKPIHIVNKM